MSEQGCSDIVQRRAQIDGGDPIATSSQQPGANGQEAAIEERKPRSGYGRLRNRHRALIAENDELQQDYFRLLDAQKVLRAECAQWKGMYLELKADLEPLIEANAK